MNTRSLSIADDLNVFVCSLAACVVTLGPAIALYGHPQSGLPMPFLVSTAIGMALQRRYWLYRLSRAPEGKVSPVWIVNDGHRDVVTLADDQVRQLWWQALADSAVARRQLERILALVARLGVQLAIAVPVLLFWILAVQSLTGAEAFQRVLNDYAGHGHLGSAALGTSAFFLLKWLLPLRLLLALVMKEWGKGENAYRQRFLQLVCGQLEIPAGTSISLGRFGERVSDTAAAAAAQARQGGA